MALSFGHVNSASDLGRIPIREARGCSAEESIRPSVWAGVPTYREPTRIGRRDKRDTLPSRHSRAAAPHLPRLLAPVVADQRG
jgi:hypothetical protein